MTPATTVQRTLSGAAAAYGLRSRDICCVSRTRAVADARAVAGWLFVRFHEHSLQRAARYLSRHHTTILHAVRRVDHDIEHGGPLRRGLTDAIRVMIEHSQEIQRRCELIQSDKSSGQTCAHVDR